jgi:LysR family glycine cleavage system transcriptional activator
MADIPRLPNLAALRAFEAAARHQNFSRAADEVHLTHGAISHQVRALEQELGVPLFVRNGKRIAITPEGERFSAVLRKALGEIAAVAEEIKAGARHPRLTITALPSFAARWLSQRLGGFIDQHPLLEVMLQSSGQLTDFSREAVDVGIRFGRGHYPGLLTELLMTDSYYPVASPRFNGGKLPRTPQELVPGTLLRCDGEPWLPWFKAAGLNRREPSGGLVYEDSSMLVRAAAEGRGIALARDAIVQTELASGELVRLFDIAIPCELSYYFVCRPEAMQKPQVRAFHDWLFEQAGRAGDKGG